MFFVGPGREGQRGFGRASSWGRQSRGALCSRNQRGKRLRERKRRRQPTCEPSSGAVGTFSSCEALCFPSRPAVRSPLTIAFRGLVVLFGGDCCLSSPKEPFWNVLDGCMALEELSSGDSSPRPRGGEVVLTPQDLCQPNAPAFRCVSNTRPPPSVPWQPRHPHTFPV